MHRGTLDLLKQLGRERTSNAVLLYNSWGIVRSDIGDIAGAAQMFESGLGIGHALWVDATPDQWVSVTYARRLVLLNRLDEADEHFSSALRLSSGEDDAEMEIGALLGLLTVNRERGDFEQARAARDRADQFVQAHLPPEHNLRMNFVFESGLLDLAEDSLDDAKARLQQVLAQYQRTNRRVDGPDRRARRARALRVAVRRARPCGRPCNRSQCARAENCDAGQPSYWLGLALLAQVDVEQALGHARQAHELSAEALSQLTPTVGADHPLTKKAAALASRASRL